MDYRLEKKKYPVCETVLDASSEQSVDLDISLPDYCPDIERILKCRICPRISSRSISGDRLDVDGTAEIKLYYLDSKKQAIRVCAHTTPFSCSFVLKGDNTDAYPCVSVKTEYLNCRALTPRRIDVHGAFTVLAKVYRKGENEYCCNIEGDDVQQKTITKGVSSLCGIGQQQFSVSEVLDIGQGRETPQSILRSQLSFKKGRCRAVSDKLMLEGECILRILYITDIDSGAQDTMTFNVPVSQVIDVQGLTESSQNFADVSIMNYTADLRSEYDESSTLIALDARLCATVMSYDENDITLITDAYSTRYELEKKESTLSLSRLLSLIDESTSVSQELSITENGITRVYDFWADNAVCVCSYENCIFTVKGKIACAVLAADSEGVPFYAERSLEFISNPQLPSVQGEIISDIRVEPTLSFRITGSNTIEADADIHLYGTVMEKEAVRVVSEAVGSDEEKADRDKTTAITLYYAEQGESLWGIARRYSTSVDAITEENELEGDTIDRRRMILIPM